MLAKVFIVEKDYSTAYALEQALKNPGGYETMTANDPQTALREIVLWEPDIIIAECLEIDGAWLCRALRSFSATKKTPIILTSHTAKNADPKKIKKYFMKKYGATDYIAKPFNVEDILKLVHKHFVLISS